MEGNTYLHGLFAAGTGTTVDEGIPDVNDAADSVRVGVQLGFEGLVLLMLTLKVAEQQTVKTTGERLLMGFEETGRTKFI